jgi:hypothetical protein
MTTRHHPVSRYLMVLFSLALTGCASTSTSQSIEQACESLVLDYAYYRDREDTQLAAQGVAAVFTEDATLTVNGQSFHGRQAIFERLAQQTNAPLTAHMMSTIRIFPEGPSRATGVSYATIYVAPRPAQGSALAEGFTAVGEYHDVFTLTPEGWRIVNRTYVARIRYQPASS